MMKGKVCVCVCVGSRLRRPRLTSHKNNTSSSSPSSMQMKHSYIHRRPWQAGSVSTARPAETQNVTADIPSPAREASCYRSARGGVVGGLVGGYTLGGLHAPGNATF